MMTIDRNVFNSLADLTKKSKRHPRTFLLLHQVVADPEANRCGKEGDRLKELT
jgi:hypothetical protein